MAQPASPPAPPMPTFAQLSGLKEAHMAFRDFLLPLAADVIAASVEKRLFQPPGENADFDKIHLYLAVYAYHVVDDPTEEQKTAYREEAVANLERMRTEGPDGPVFRKLRARAAEVVAEGLKAAWIAAHRGEQDFTAAPFPETLFTQTAFGRFAGEWGRGGHDEGTGIPARYFCSLPQAIDIFLRARAGLPADQAFPPGGKKLLDFAMAG